LKALKRIVDTFLARFIRPESLILKQLEGGAPRGKSKRLCLFSHFDRRNRIAPYVLHYLQCLRELGADIVFITTSEQLDPAEIPKLQPYCIQIIQRKNMSLDFGSWRIGLLQAKTLSSYDQLILANDSVYGPLFPLPSVFEKMEPKKLDVWGITSTQEKTYHIQSYFLVLSKRVFQSEPFTSFWNGFQYYRSKERIISEYEIGLSRLARRENWKMGAYIEHSEMEGKGKDLNPTLFHWDLLIEKLQCPFLKTEVLRLNRANSPRVGQWEDIIRTKTGYDTALIAEHLGP